MVSGKPQGTPHPVYENLYLVTHILLNNEFYSCLPAYHIPGDLVHIIIVTGSIETHSVVVMLILQIINLKKNN